jgi:hypothetical protein
VQPRSAAGYGSEHLHKGRRDNVGKGHLPAGTGDNLQRPRAQGESQGAGRVVVWRMSPYERRRGGNAPPGGPEAAPARVTPGPGKGALGTRWPRQSARNQTQSWVLRGLRRGEGAMQTPPASGRRVRQHRSFAPWGKARPEKWRAAPRPEPDSGNPTVRDRRGASGNVASWSMISTRRARLTSISTTARTVRCGGRRRPRASRPRRAARAAPPADPTMRAFPAASGKRPLRTTTRSAERDSCFLPKMA